MEEGRCPGGGLAGTGRLLTRVFLDGREDDCKLARGVLIHATQHPAMQDLGQQPSRSRRAVLPLLQLSGKQWVSSLGLCFHKHVRNETGVAVRGLAGRKPRLKSFS